MTPAKFENPPAGVAAAAAPDNGMKFEWKGNPMDTSGILYYFGTNFGKRPWSNPSISGLVKCSASSLAKDSSPVSTLTGREVVRLVTAPEVNSWYYPKLPSSFANRSFLHNCSSLIQAQI